jgi:hypothetical protein
LQEIDKDNAFQILTRFLTLAFANFNMNFNMNFNYVRNDIFLMLC